MTTRDEWRKAWRRIRCKSGLLAAKVYHARMAGELLPTRRFAAVRGRYLLRRMFPDGVRKRPLPYTGIEKAAGHPSDGPACSGDGPTCSDGPACSGDGPTCSGGTHL